MVGLPSRTPEMGTLTYRNTNLLKRHLFIINGNLVSILRYNKTRSMLGSDRLIARSLPPDVGEVLLKYLVLIRPFEM